MWGRVYGGGTGGVLDAYSSGLYGGGMADDKVTCCRCPKTAFVKDTTSLGWRRSVARAGRWFCAACVEAHRSQGFIDHRPIDNRGK